MTPVSSCETTTAGGPSGGGVTDLELREGELGRVEAQGAQGVAALEIVHDLYCRNTATRDSVVSDSTRTVCGGEAYQPCQRVPRLLLVGKQVIRLAHLPLGLLSLVLAGAHHTQCKVWVRPNEA